MSGLVFISLRSGSFGNSYVVSDGETTILIDAGAPKKLVAANTVEMGLPPPRALFITHEHHDHTKSLAPIARHFAPKIFATPGTIFALGRKLETVGSAVVPIDAGTQVAVGKFAVSSILISHDAAQPVAFRIDHTGGESAAILSDMGDFGAGITDFACGAGLVLIEANYDPQLLRNSWYPEYLKRRIASRRGHLSNYQCARLAGRLIDSGTKLVVLGHISENNNTPDLALNTVRAHIDFPHLATADRYNPRIFSL